MNPKWGHTQASWEIGDPESGRKGKRERKRGGRAGIDWQEIPGEPGAGTRVYLQLAEGMVYGRKSRYTMKIPFAEKKGSWQKSFSFIVGKGQWEGALQTALKEAQEAIGKLPEHKRGRQGRRGTEQAEREIAQENRKERLR